MSASLIASWSSGRTYACLGCGTAAWTVDGFQSLYQAKVGYPRQHLSTCIIVEAVGLLRLVSCDGWGCSVNNISIGGTASNCFTYHGFDLCLAEVRSRHQLRQQTRFEVLVNLVNFGSCPSEFLQYAEVPWLTLTSVLLLFHSFEKICPASSIACCKTRHHNNQFVMPLLYLVSPHLSMEGHGSMFVLKGHGCTLYLLQASWLTLSCLCWSPGMMTVRPGCLTQSSSACLAVGRWTLSRMPWIKAAALAMGFARKD